MRRRLLFVSVFSFLVVSYVRLPLAHAILKLNQDGQIGVSRWWSASNSWRVWTMSSSVSIRSRLDEATVDTLWQDMLGEGVSVSSSPKGIAAASWLVGISNRERAYWVSSDGSKLYEQEVIDGWRAPLVSIDPPIKGVTYTGFVAASSHLVGGHRIVRCFATFSDGTLRDRWQDTTDPAVPPAWDNLESGISMTLPIAASNSPTEDITRVFAVKSLDSSIFTSYRGGGGWTEFNIGRPVDAGGAYVNVCGSMAASEEQIDTSTPRVLLYCTKTGTASSLVYLAYAPSFTPTAVGLNRFIWANPAQSLGSAVQNNGYSLAMARRLDDPNRAIDAFVLLNNNHIWHAKRVSGPLENPPFEDLGLDGESSDAFGGLAATPTNLGYSYVYYLGLANTNRRLYRRIGDGGAEHLASDPRSWANMGDGLPWWSVAQNGIPHSETSTAIFGGTGVTASIVRPGPGSTDWPYVQMSWSNDDLAGDFDGAVTIDSPAGAQYISDPSVAIDDAGRAFISAAAVNTPSGDCTDGTGSTIDAFFVRTTDGSTFDEGPTPYDDSTYSDHPWMDIQRIPGAADLLHFTWFHVTDNYATYEVRYRNGTDDNPVTLNGVHTLAVGVDGEGDPIAAPPELSVGKNGAVYVAWGNKVCRLNKNLDGCRGLDEGFGAGIHSLDGDLAAAGLVVNIPGRTYVYHDPVGGGDFVKPVLVRGSGWSLRASLTDENKVYRAFAGCETNGDGPDLDDDHDNVHCGLDSDGEEFDIYLSIGTFVDNHNGNENDDFFSFDGPFQVTTGSYYDDNRDQFGPAVAVTSDVWPEIVSVSWYDRNVSLNDETACGGFVNRCYRAYRSVSKDAGLTFQGRLEIRNTDQLASDPDLLPHHCGTPEAIRFIGDQREVRGDAYHSFHVVALAPLGSDPDTADLYSGWVSGGYWYW